MSKVWFITGSSRGLGLALTEAVLNAGHQVVAGARQPEQLADLCSRYGDQLQVVKLDVTSAADVEKAFEAGLQAFKRLDIVVNNAGYGFIGAFEEMSPEEFESQINTNFWGVVKVTRAAIPILRRQGYGHLIQITSVGGRAAFPGLSGYHSAKFAVEGFSEAVAQEIKPLGIKMTIVEPGGFRTDWAGSSMAFATPIQAYDVSVRSVRKLLEGITGHEPGDPGKAAGILLKIADLDEAPLRLPLGNDAMAVLRSSYKKSLDELERWAYLTKATDFDGLTVSDTDHPILTQQ